MSVSPGRAAAGTSITLSAVPTGAPGTNSVCRYEALRNGASVWSSSRDPNCREATTRLDAGTYTFRLVIDYRSPAGAAASSSSELRDYVVTPGSVIVGTLAPAVFSVSDLTLDPDPEAGREVKVRMKIKNLGDTQILSLPWRISGAVSANGRVRLDAKSETEVTATFTAPSRSVEVTGEVDQDNELNETQSQRSDNRRTIRRAIKPPVPVIVLGSVVYKGPGFVLPFTICNVDPDAIYRFSRGCNDRPSCALLAMPFGGRARTDFLADRFSDNGTMLNPPCPANLPFRGGLQPGIVQGPRPTCGDPLVHKLVVEGLARAEASFTVNAVSPRCAP
ncbi:MAG TPA: hypothetical protein VFV34_15145 [Blastocatellia bacterium]|nr:hypothetical protein [Blastocatellia bacterium]